MRRTAKYLSLVLGAALCVLLGACNTNGSASGSGSGGTVPTGGSADSWAWVTGSGTAGPRGVYGTQGSAASTNLPGGRAGGVTWRDSSGTFWLFGGYGTDSAGHQGYLGDLWKFDAVTALWTWVGGSTDASPAGAYGTQGSATSTNGPGGRQGSIGWVDGSGDLWLFGGIGLDASGNSGPLNDLWKFSPMSGEWTWVGGSKFVSSTGVYGTRGTAGSANVPGARHDAVSWIDAAGNLWLFGGEGQDAAGNTGSLNDLWEYNPTTTRWTWVSGSATHGAPGLYGTLGAASSGNTPGARFAAVSWIDAAGTLWLYGGQGSDSTGQNGLLSDLWQFDPGTGAWTWVAGDYLANATGVYGTLGMAAASNAPGARQGAIAWIDSAGDLWLFGGEGFGTGAAASGYLSDVWKFSPGTGQWAWVAGASSANTAGIYGTQGTAAKSNTPGGRVGARGWVDSNNALWLVGGEGVDGKGNVGYLNDLWRFTP